MSARKSKWLSCRRFAIAAIQNEAEIREELSQTIEELAKLKTSNNQHPAVGKLFNWLVDPQRTGEEFHYAFDVLPYDVYMDTDQDSQGVDKEDYCMYRVQIAFEALAVMCPILEGQWEKVAWTMAGSTFSYNKQDYGVASDRLTAWIIQVVADPDMCPNSGLRLSLMTLLLRMVDLDHCKRIHIIDSVLVGLSSIEVYVIYFQMFQERGARLFITNLFEVLAKDGYLLEFDKELSKQLLDVKPSRCSAVVHDVTYRFAVNPTRFTEPLVMDGLISLLKAVCEGMKYFSIVGMNIKLSTKEVNNASNVVYILMSNFKLSCQTPQLVSLAASCIIGISELVIIYNVDLVENGKDINQDCLKKIDQLLIRLFANHPPSSTPLGQELCLKYAKTAEKLRGLLYSYAIFNDFPMIKAFIDEI